jgi:fused signal recognition particle receptor
MFNFLKDKLKSAISKFSKEVEEDEKEIEEDIQEEKEILEEEKELEVPKEEKSEKEETELEQVQKEIDDEDAPVTEEPITQEKEVKEAVKEIEQKELEKERIEKEKEIEEKEKLEQVKEEIEEKEKEILEQEKEVIEVSETQNVSDDAQKLKISDKKELEKEKIELEKEVEEIEGKKSFLNIFKKKKKEEVGEKPKKSIFSRVAKPIITKKIDQNKFEELFWELELALLENNVAVEVIEKIKQDLKENLVGKPLTRTKVVETINKTLKSSIKEILEVDKINLLEKIKEKKPYVICFIGINGSGKTTSIAKVAKFLQNNNISCVLAAADTFRAAAIDQIQHHADKLGIKLIKQDYGSDPAAVAFDAIKHAEAKNIDVVLIDTAGRMHNNSNLQDEMKKIIRVAKPDMKIFVGESITGNDCTEQAKQFNESIEIDGIILSKQDIDEKGGAALSVSYITKKPILYIGTGQEYDDLKEFSSDIILDNLGL